eukprot:1823593-Prymnesium_polylepis.1
MLRRFHLADVLCKECERRAKVTDAGVNPFTGRTPEWRPRKLDPLDAKRSIEENWVQHKRSPEPALLTRDEFNRVLFHLAARHVGKDKR